MTAITSRCGAQLIIVGYEKGIVRSDLSFDHTQERFSDPDDESYLLPLLQYEYMSAPLKVHFRGIVLRKTGGAVGEFCRVGSVYFDWVMDDLTKLMGTACRETAKKVCAKVISNPKRPDRKYVITLI